VKVLHVPAAALLLLGALAHYGWKWVPPHAQADVWNASQALLLLALLGMLAATQRHPHLRLVCALLASGQVLAAGCSLAWLWQPWPVLPGQGQCSAALDVPLALIGLWLVALVALHINPRKDGRHDAAGT